MDFNKRIIYDVDFSKDGLFYTRKGFYFCLECEKGYKKISIKVIFVQCSSNSIILN